MTNIEPINPKETHRLHMEESESGQAYTLSKNIELARSPIRHSQRFLRSKLLIIEVLKGYDFGIEYWLNSSIEAESDPLISSKSKGLRPSAFDRGFMKAISDCKNNNIRAIIGSDDHEPYNEIVNDLQLRYPEEWENNGYF